VRHSTDEGLVLDAVEQYADGGERTQREAEAAGDSFEAHVGSPVEWNGMTDCTQSCSFNRRLTNAMPETGINKT
jgi:hypothetical protein